MEKSIRGGFILKARSIAESEIAHAPPHIREVWDWLIRRANYKEAKVCGRTIKRGQCLCTYRDILDGLSWKVGYRTERYTKAQCEITMKFLRRGSMITTTRTTRGMIVTVCNYDHYQNPESYESHNESHNESHDSPQPQDTVYKNGKKNKNVKEKRYISIFGFWNLRKITQHKKLTEKIKRKIQSALKDYTEEEILGAVDNYSMVTKEAGTKYYWPENQRWTLVEFLQRGLERFLPSADPLKSFLKSGTSQTVQKLICKECGQSFDDNPEKKCSFCGAKWKP